MSFDQDPNEQANISSADFAAMVDEMKALKQERDELAAMVVIMRDALVHLVNHAENCEVIIEGEWGSGRSMSERYATGCVDESLVVANKAISITGPAAVHEIRAKVLEEAASRLQSNCCHIVRKLAAAERAEGEK